MKDEVIKVKPIETILVPEKLAKMWEDFSVCESACKDIIKEVVHEYEKCAKQKKAWWDVIKEHYGYNGCDYVIEYNKESGKLVVWDKTKHELRQAFECFDQNIEIKNRIKKIWLGEDKKDD